MDWPPPTIPPQRQTPHPRRPPAHKSVSLRHSPPATGAPPKAPTFYHPSTASVESPNVGASDKANPPSSVSPQVLSNKNSSGESSDAGKWFENTNNAVQSNNNLENDPPFFLHNSSSSETPPEGHPYDSLYQRTTSMPYRPGIVHTNNESVEDFRSVIDDLTVANKKLKQKLKKYEKLHDTHLQDEKLFEVRFHGLPDYKKRELEETLRKFAADLDHSPERSYPAISSHPAPFDAQKTADSHVSRLAESGYASMSGHNSNSARSNQPSNTASSNDRDDHRMTKSQYNQQQQSIQSYLHDIPHGLLPKSHTPMTDKSKKRLVVRRLEQIFAGKRSAPGNHPQPMQQEEVAQSAATADRRAKEAAGQHAKTEGNREARIMPVRADDEDITGQQEALERQEALQKLRPNLHVSEQDFAGSGSPDQRPTRPLDLDLYRAQVPSDNMDYIRHLGFTPPDMMSGDSPEDGHGWIYLNLLINMAQLHTLNVTSEFVKQAVTEYSSTFELSHDGRKIRWRGHSGCTLSSTGSSSEYQGNDSPYDPHGNSRSPSKYLKAGGSGSTDRSMDPEQGAARRARKQKEKERNQFAYTPLFFHQDDSGDDADSYGLDVRSSSHSPFPPQQAGDSSGLGSSKMQSSSSRRRRNDGPIIFYSKAKFCTDLTGDSRGIASHTADSYQNITSHPIGAPAAPENAQKQDPDNTERRAPLETTSMMDVDSPEGSQIHSSSEEMHFSPDDLKDDNGTESPEVVDFEASGLGGVHPEDNFSIRVRRSQQQTAPATATAARRKSQQHYSKKIQDALNQRSSPEAGASSPKQKRVIKEQILSASRQTLPNSTLPPASFLPFDSTSSGDVDSDLESNVSSNPSTTSSSEENAGPATALHLLNISPMRRESLIASEESSSGDEGDESSNDGSIDLLATARRMDPHTIIASEREYDAALADRLADDIPAGSSAATAGGGSGFNSPADGIIAALNEEAEQPGRRSSVKRQSTTSGSMSSRTKLKRSRTRESIATALQESSKRQKNQKRERRDV
ncbi:hypothetical protein SLS60_008809 [Paraconiothyrium brasiliense]|uniref:Frequency clock protein n=1 Tax=Paraconiothyrium brasiliense TaxID=300254 RepID=A0ABR3QYJ1_9PLEO